MSYGVAIAAGLQALGSIMNMISQSMGRKTPKMPKDPFASLTPAAKAAMQQGLSGVPNARALRQLQDAIKRQYAGTLQQVTRGVGPSYESRIRANLLSEQGKAIAESTATAWQQAQAQKSRLAAMLASRSAANLGRAGEWAWRTYQTPTTAQRATGAVGQGLGSGANMAMLLQMLQESGRKPSGNQKNWEWIARMLSTAGSVSQKKTG